MFWSVDAALVGARVCECMGWVCVCLGWVCVYGCSVWDYEYFHCDGKCTELAINLCCQVLSHTGCETRWTRRPAKMQPRVSCWRAMPAQT